MKSVLSIMIILFAIAIFYVLKLPPRHVSLRDLSPVNIPHSVQTEPSARETSLNDNSGNDSIFREIVSYYIIVESVKDLKSAQNKAAKLRKEYKDDFIILPRTRDGYFRISCGKYSTQEEAKSTIRIIREKIRADAWILSAEK